MTDDNVVYLKKPKRFTLTEAKLLLPKVREMTAEVVSGVEPLVQKIQETKDHDLQMTLSHELQLKIDAWIEEVRKLGVVPKGLWLVDFDSGEGYFCWQYNEPDLLFFHGYHEGFSNRVPIQ